MAAARRPAGDHRDDPLGHEPDETLALQDVEPAGPGRVDRVGRLAAGVLVAGAAPDALVAAGAEGPAAVLRAGAVAGDEDAADVARRAGVVEGPVQLVDRVGPEGVPDLGAVEGDADDAGVDGPVVGDVGEREPLHGMPPRGIEDLRDHGPHCGRPWPGGR